nr:hypothetical protein [Kofleriaceae bacterium]
MSLRPCVVALAVAVACSLGAAAARADTCAGPRPDDVTPFLSPGITIGVSGTGTGSGSAVTTEPGFVIGGELSIVRVSQPADCSAGSAVNALDWLPVIRWLGAYIDGVYDTHGNVVRISLGPEVGWEMFGLDGGFLVREQGGHVSPGFAVRGVLTFGYVQLYVRGESARTGEAGLLLKWPFAVHARDRVRSPNG